MNGTADSPTAERSGTTFLAAALAVLRAKGRTLTDREITDLAIERGLLQTRGKTPHATMAACLYTAARDHPEIGLVRIHDPGPTRARRGSVRWTLRPDGLTEPTAQ